MEKSKHIIAIPPGETIHELLDDREMTQKEFAIRMSMSEKYASELINGKAALTPQVAIDLESVLGVEAVFWNNLESQYKEKLIRIEREKAIEAKKQV